MRDLVDEIPLIAENISINGHADAQSQNVIEFPQHVLDIALASLNPADTLQSTHSYTHLFSDCHMPECGTQNRGDGCECTYICTEIDTPYEFAYACAYV